MAETASTEVLFTSMEAVHRLSKNIQGVLGQACLGRFDYLLDLRRGRIVFGTRETQGLKAEMFLLVDRPAVYTSSGWMVIDSGVDRLVLFKAGPVKAWDRRLMIEGREVWRGDAAVVARQEGFIEDGLLPAAAFDSIYFSNSKGYLVFQRVPYLLMR
jgi:hypothetical protein